MRSVTENWMTPSVATLKSPAMVNLYPFICTSPNGIGLLYDPGAL